MNKVSLVLALLVCITMTAQEKDSRKNEKGSKEIAEKNLSADKADRDDTKPDSGNAHWRTSPLGESDILHQMALRKTDFLIEELRISREQDKEKIFRICKKQVKREQDIEREYGSGKVPSPEKKKALENSQQVFMKEVQEALSLADPQ